MTFFIFPAFMTWRTGVMWSSTVKWLSLTHYPYADNMTLEDLIIQAGGLREAASVVRVDVSRRIKNPYSTVDNDTIGQMYTFALKDGFLVLTVVPALSFSPTMRFMFVAYPVYQPQQNVSVEGEILFGGSYAMTSREERLSDLINKAGGASTTLIFVVRSLPV